MDAIALLEQRQSTARTIVASLDDADLPGGPVEDIPLVAIQSDPH